MSNSTSVRQLNYSFSQKVTARNPAYRSTINIGQATSSSKPFSRKPANQNDHLSLHHTKQNDNQADMSIMQKSVFDNQSVVSGGRSVRQTKFVRTSKMDFLSPKSKKKERDESFSPRHMFGTQSAIFRPQMNVSKNTLNDSIRQKQQIVSQSSVQQNQIYLQKSISSTNLFRRNNKTRNMILSKFNQLAKNSSSKQNKNKLQTSLYTACMQNQKEEKMKIQRMNVQMKEKNQEIEKQCESLWRDNDCLKRENVELKDQVAQLTRRLNEIQSARANLVLEEKTFARTNQQQLGSSASTSALLSRQKLPSFNNNNINQQGCQKCDQKEKSNQRQVAYFQNIIKKKQVQLSALKRKQTQLTQENSQLSLSLQKTTVKLTQLLQHEKILSETQQKLQECVNELKWQVSRLKDQLRYLKIENSVLLKIKNQNLKLKIDITKIQDERDYFKMKVIEIHKKHGTTQNPTRGVSQKYIREKGEIVKKIVNSQKLKKVYLDSTETEQMDSQFVENERKRNKSKTLPGFKSNLDAKEPHNKQSKSKHQQTDFTSSGPYSDTLFDLTSEESESSY